VGAKVMNKKNNVSKFFSIFLFLCLFSSTVFADLNAQWALDENSGNIASDQSVNGIHLNLNNMSDTNWVTGYSGSALDFNGTDQDASISTGANVLQTASITLSAWVYPEATSGDRWVLAQGNNFGLYLKPGNQTAIFYIKKPGNGWTGISTPGSSISLNEWQHIAASFNAVTKTLKIYVNGVEVNTINNFHDISYTTGNGFTIGSMQGTNLFNGSIDEVHVYDSALTDGDILQLSDSVDDIPPVISLNGENPVFVLLDTSSYTDAGATAVDNVDDSVAVTHDALSVVNTAVEGDYTVTFTATDLAGNSANTTRLVKVVTQIPDNTAPVITLNGENPVSVIIDTDYIDSGATAIDDVDGSVTVDHDAESVVDTTVEGSYTVTFTATDLAGNIANTTRIVNVFIPGSDDTPPVITLNGANPVSVTLNTSYTDAGATATDNIDGSVNVTHDADSSVDISIEGSYTVNFSAIDSAGNSASTTRIVNVVDTPIIDGLSGQWTLDENSGIFANDQSGNGLHLNLNNMSDTDWVFGHSGSALGFNGTDQDASISSGTSLLQTESVTLSAWVYPETTSGNAWVSAQGDNYGLFLKPGNRSAVFYIKKPGNGWTSISTPGNSFVFNEWQHITGSFNFSTKTLKIYINGFEVNTDNIFHGISYTNGDGFTLASMQGTNLFKGRIDDVHIYNSALTNAEIFQLSEAVDDTPPVITLNGANPISIARNTDYTDAGASAVDNVDGSVTVDHDAESVVDTTVEGSYTVTFTATDLAGNSASTTRTVNVINGTAPIITLVGDSSITIPLNADYTDAGASAFDNDDNVSIGVDIDASDIDIFVMGNYTVTFTATDSDGFTSIATRSVTVAEPVLGTLKILPLGDSITDSYLGRTSYRRPLWHQLKSAGYNVDFVGRPSYRHTTAPESSLDFDIDHEGHAGWRADQIRNNISGWLDEFSADIVLLHIGTNDLLQAPAGETAFDTVNITLDDIDGIIQNIRAANSSIVILLAKIIPMVDYDTAVFNNEVDAFVSANTTPESPIVVVDQYSGFNAIDDTHDNIHPNEGGQIKMATKWFQALEPFLTSTVTPLTHLLPHNQWHQISLPLNPGSNNTVANIFGDDGLGAVYGTDWDLYSYNPSSNSYERPGITDTLSQGVGYWIIQMSGDDKLLTMPTGSTETPTTNPTGCPVDKDCFEIPLATKGGENQWNMVGYPFAVSGLLSNSRIVASTSGCTSGCGIEVAEDDGVFQNQLWSYNGAEYVEVTTTIGTLDPWLGYWAATLDNASTNNPSLLFSK